MTIGVGQVEVIKIRIENVKDLYGAELHMKFDPSVVEVVDADPTKDGIQLMPGDFPKPEFVALNRADNKVGTIDYALTQLNPTPPANGSGTVVSILFRGKALGKSTKITSKGNILPVVVGPQKVMPTPFTWQDGTITIVPPKPPTPTPTGKATVTLTPARAQSGTLVATRAPTEAPPAPSLTPAASTNDRLVMAGLILVAGGGCLGTLALLAVAAFLLLRRPSRRPAPPTYNGPARAEPWHM